MLKLYLINRAVINATGLVTIVYNKTFIKLRRNKGLS